MLVEKVSLMKVKRSITKDIKNNIIHLTFNEMLDEYLIVVISSVVAYFKAEYEDVCLVGNDIYVNGVNTVIISVNGNTIDCKVNTKHLNIITTMAFISIQTYLNIYFNLYETNQYHKVLDFYNQIKKK